MEQVYLKEGKLLNEDGTLSEAGYAFTKIKDYNREKINWFNRIKRKEWDYYAFLNDKNGVAITMSNLTYSALLSFTYFDFEVNKYLTKSFTIMFPKRKDYKIPKTGNNILIRNKNFTFSVKKSDVENSIYVNIKKFADGCPLLLNLEFTEETDKSIVTTIPFKKKGNFYYNQKMNLLRAEGNIQIGKKSFSISESYGVLDRGRGVWPYKTTRYWSSCSAKDNEGNLIGFNLGYGLGDSSEGSENVLFFNKEIHKLNDVKFIFKEEKKGKIDYLKDIEVISESNDINLIFTPCFNRHDNINVGVIASNQNQVFGRFNGTITVDGVTYEFKNYLGFLEKVINRY